MKSCPKCNRTYPDDHQKFCTFDGGLLIAGGHAFDPNATIASTRVSGSEETIIVDPGSDLTATRDLSATIASRATPTGGVSKPTGPTGFETMFEKAPAPRHAPPLPTSAVNGPAVPVVSAPAKKSKLPLILGGLALLLILGVGAAAAIFVFVIKPQLDEEQAERPAVTQPKASENTAPNVNANTTVEQKPVEEVAPPNSVRFVNSSANLDGRLAQHYMDFSFYYPKSWQSDPKAGVPGANNFVKVERKLPPDLLQENFTVGWYDSKGTFEADESTFPQLVEKLGSSLGKVFAEYEKVSEGPTKVNGLNGYEFRFVSVSRGTDQGDVNLWGRVIFLPTGVAGDSTGATLVLLATSLAPEITGAEGVGQSGQMPVILESFRFGKK